MRVEILQGIASAADKLKRKVLSTYETICSGIDPATGGQIYVDCTVNSTTYRMNAGKVAATAMDSGVRLTEQVGALSMDVRDFNNVVHAVPLEDAISIRNQQALDAHGHWLRKCQIVDEINAATTVGELNQVDTSFSVLYS